MIAKILFLSAAAFVAYRYIASSNKKAHELRQQRTGVQQVLPPADQAVQESATVTQREPRPVLATSSAAEPDPGR
jgi:hypothetical protein